MFKNFWHGLARMFTIPRAQRDKINALDPALKGQVASALLAAAAGEIAKKTGDPTEQAILGAAVAIGLQHAGLGQ